MLVTEKLSRVADKYGMEIVLADRDPANYKRVNTTRQKFDESSDKIEGPANEKQQQRG